MKINLWWKVENWLLPCANISKQSMWTLLMIIASNNTSKTLCSLGWLWKINLRKFPIKNAWKLGTYRNLLKRTLDLFHRGVRFDRDRKTQRVMRSLSLNSLQIIQVLEVYVLLVFNLRYSSTITRTKKVIYLWERRSRELRSNSLVPVKLSYTPHRKVIRLYESAVSYLSNSTLSYEFKKRNQEIRFEYSSFLRIKKWLLPQVSILTGCSMSRYLW